MRHPHGYRHGMAQHPSSRSRVRRLGAVATAAILLSGAVACGDDDGDIELPPGPTEPTVPDTTPTEDLDPEPTETIPGATPGPIDDDVQPPAAGGGEPGETPE